MKIERKITIQLDESEENLFTDFLDFLEITIGKMNAYSMDLDAETVDIFTDLKNAQSLLDRAYTAIVEEEVNF